MTSGERSERSERSEPRQASGPATATAGQKPPAGASPAQATGQAAMSANPGRHRAPEQPDRHVDDRSRERIGAHVPAAGPFAGATIPAPELVGQLRTERSALGPVLAVVVLCLLLLWLCGNW